MEQSFTKVIDLIYLAKQDGIEIVLNDERLQLKIPDNKVIDKKLLEEIRTNKSLIIDFLSNSNWQSRAVTKNHDKINRFDRQEVKKIPLSFSQERLWFIDQLEGSVQYNIPTVLRLKGQLNIEALSNALQTIVGRHEALRTAFGEDHGQPFQYIRDQNEWNLNIIEGSFYEENQQGLQKYIDELIKKPFDLSKDYMMRADLIILAAQEHIVVVTMHHIASDAWSLPIIVREVVELYKANDEDRTIDLPQLDIQYADFAVWQREHLQGELMDRKTDYWKKKLDDVAPLQLPTDYTRPSIKTIKGAITSSRIDKDLTGAIKSLGQQQGTSLFMTLLAAYNVLLGRYSNQEDICVGTSIAGRKPEEIVGLIGFFANTLALRTQVNLNMSFIELLEQVKQTTMEAYENQEVSFDKVVETVVKERDPGRSPLFQVMLVLHNTPEVPQLQLGEVQLTNEAFENNISKFDITFFLNETVNGLQCSVQYRTDIFREETIVRMIAHFKELLSSIVKSPGQAIGSLRILTQGEEHQLLVAFNDTRIDYPKEKTVTTLFEEQAATTPDEIALVFEEEQLTYKDLNERANQLAHFLRRRGVKEETLVPLCVERSHHMLIGMLGILKAGAAYVPVEPDFPEDRKSFVLSDTAAKVIVSTRESSAGLPLSEDVTIIEIDDQFSPIRAQSRDNVQTDLRPHHLAYVIYTSGSTGRPKGVMIEHRNLVDYVFGLKQTIEIYRCRSYALVSSIATDLGNTAIYSSIVFGGALHVFSKESVSNIEYLHEYFSTHPIDCLKIVPSHWKALAMEEKPLLPTQLLIFGGETLPLEVIEQIYISGSLCRVVNHYGPTETTVGKLLHRVDSERKYNKTIPIGKTFSNSRVYVLSKDMELCPVGIPGQLYISGEGIARGYLNNIELTDQKFINNRFNRRDTHPMYATGDLVRWLWDGNIEFIGRADDQVKIRGYRVELGEIESLLLQSGLVAGALVLAKEDKDGNKRLIAYTVGIADYDKESIVRYLWERLPDYMVPTQWVELESFPMLPNGKVDRKSLPDPEETDQLTKQYVAPRNEIESRLAALWADVLEVDQVGVHDDFFELGGHSLLAVRLISAIRKEFVVEMPIGDIFDYPAVAQLAEQIARSSDKAVLPSVVAVQSRPERIPLSFSQERLWFIDRLEGTLHYHVPTVLRVKGALNTDALTHALQEIIKRHEVLRTIIREEDGQGYQHIQDADKWYLPISVGTKYKEDINGLRLHVQQLISRPFDLSKDYMLRADLIRIEVNEYVLVSTFHHIASDGWSTSVLVKELTDLYRSYQEGRSLNLSPLPIQYADYALWQREYLQGDILENKLGYWKNKLEGVTPLQLPLDLPRPAVQSIRGTFESFLIDEELSEALQKLSQQHGATLFMTLLAAFKILLSRYSGQNDICVGTPVAGRQQQELESLIGFFINTLALRSDLSNNLSFVELLHGVKKTTLEAYAHQDLPFEKIVDAIVKERVMSRTPIFQVMFTLQNTPEIPMLELGDVQFSRESFAIKTSKFDLTLNLAEVSQGLQGYLLYCTDLFTSQTIKRMIAHFKELLHSIVREPSWSIRELSMLTEPEVRQLEGINTSVVEYP